MIKGLWYGRTISPDLSQWDEGKHNRSRGHINKANEGAQWAETKDKLLPKIGFHRIPKKKGKKLE